MHSIFMPSVNVLTYADLRPAVIKHDPSASETKQPEPVGVAEQIADEQLTNRDATLGTIVNTFA